MSADVYQFESSTDLFSFKSIAEILAMSSEEFLIQHLVPRQGFGVLYGASGSLKSFVALDMSVAIALGRPWGGRDVKQGAAFYIAAEGASGLSKRVAGIMQRQGMPEAFPFYLLTVSPDLGNARSGDAQKLIRSIRSTGRSPSIIVLDTLAQMLHGGDENGQGMQAFVRNAQTIASALDCFVLAVHHVGHHADSRLRGHSSLPAAADLIIRAERLPDAPAVALSVDKSKDGPTDIRLTATMRRVTLGTDAKGNESDTLVVDRLEDGLPSREERKAKGNGKGGPNDVKLWTKAYRDTESEHGAEADGFEELHRQRFYLLKGGESESANRQAYRRGRTWLIEKGKLDVTENGMRLVA
jgi:AAA domain